jgi:hypothetical protein
METKLDDFGCNSSGYIVDMAFRMSIPGSSMQPFDDSFQIFFNFTNPDATPDCTDSSGTGGDDCSDAYFEEPVGRDVSASTIFIDMNNAQTTTIDA